MTVNVLYDRVAGNTIPYTYVNFCDASDQNIRSIVGITANILATATGIPPLFLKKSTSDYWNSSVNKDDHKTYISLQ